MELRKLFLYLALGVVAFSLWTAWQQDNAQTVAKQQALQKTVTTQTQDQTQPQNGVAQKPQAAHSVIAPAPANRVINIKTDVLSLAIDTLGGNILRADLIKYPATQKPNSAPIRILSDSADDLYVAQSGLQGIQNHKPLQYSVARKTYQLASGQKQLAVNLNWKRNGVTVTKTLAFTPGSYVVDVNYKVTNISGKNITGKVFNQIQRKKLKGSTGFFRLHTYNGASISSPETPYEKLTYADMDKHDVARTVQGGWVAMQQRYFLSAWIPNQAQAHSQYSHVSDDIYTVGTTTPINVAAGKTVSVNSKFYIGPEIKDSLAPLAKGLDHTIDFGWLWLLSIAVFWVMQHINNVIGNWGWSIILVTVLIKLVFYKFSETSYISMAKMRSLAPKMKMLRDRYAGNKQEMSKATMELYRKEKVNPLGGCLPMVIQIPVFIALYYVLLEAVQLRQAPFMFWIHDLSVHDPYYILPVLMGISMFFQQKLNPAPPDPMQAKVMMFLPVIFTGVFLSFPSGLVLYWLVNNVLSILQQWHILRKYEKGQIKEKVKSKK